MTIWVDSDSCPTQIRDIICRAAVRMSIEAVFVANRRIPISEGPYTHMEIVDDSEGSADRFLVTHAREGDMTITRDIPLAAELVGAGVTALDDRGSVYTSNNIGERLSMRNFMYQLREAGVNAERHRAMSGREVSAFARAFDRELLILARSAAGPA